ncbi:MAG: hypothetical protein ACREO8_06580 [Luteimonas sp.]
MAWTNAFTIGPCTLAVHKNNSEVAMTPAEMVEDGASISIDGDGLVKMVTLPFSMYTARVIPSYATNRAPVRLSEMNISPADGGIYFGSTWDGATTGPGLSRDETLAVVPDPAAFEAGEAWTFAGMYLGYFGPT